MEGMPSGTVLHDRRENTKCQRFFECAKDTDCSGLNVCCYYAGSAIRGCPWAPAAATQAQGTRCLASTDSSCQRVCSTSATCGVQTCVPLVVPDIPDAYGGFALGLCK